VLVVAFAVLGVAAPSVRYARATSRRRAHAALDASFGK
jgi:hypothetical protein